MKISFTPKSSLGKYSIGLILAMPILFYLGMSFVDFYKFTPAGETILKDIISRPLIALPMLGGFFSGITSLILGLFGIIKNKDYSILVFMSTLIGFLVLLWVFAEILFKH